MKKLFCLAALVASTLVPLSAQAQFDFAEPEPPVWESFKLNPSRTIKLDFRNASVDAIIQTLTQASGVSIIKDPSLNTMMSLQSPRPQKLTDAFAMFNAALGLRNFDLKKEGNFLVIRPRRGGGRGGFGGGFGGGAGNFGGGGFGAGRGAQPTLKVYPVKFASATQVARIINEVFANVTDTSSTGGGNTPGFPAPPGGGRGGAAPSGASTAPGDGTSGANGGVGTAANPQGTEAQDGVQLVGGQGGGGFGGFGGQGGFNPFAGGGQNRRTAANPTSLVKASADDFSNSVIVTAPTREHDQIVKLVEQIDKPSEQPQRSKVFPLKYANATEIVTTISNVLVSNAPRGRGNTSTTQGQTIDQRFQFGFRGAGAQAGSGAVTADSRTNSLIVTATAENLALVGQLIEQLDQPVKYENGAYVVTLQNARADAVAQLINQAFSRNSTGNQNTNLSQTNRNTGTTGSRRNTNSNTPQGLNGGTGGRSRAVTRAAGTTRAAEDDDGIEIAQGPGGGGLFGGGGGGGFQFQNQNQNQNQQNRNVTGYDSSGQVVNVRSLQGNVVAIPDVNTNSVIIVASPENRQIVANILDQLDKIPEQVMIETVIVEASLDTSRKLGVEFNFTVGNSGFTSSFGDKANTAQPQGLRYTLTGTQYGAFLQALQSDTRFEVLSTPRIFTSNNATAEINISQSLPYVTSQTVDPSTGNFFYNYAFLDVGIVLTVTPRITSNGFVTMDVTQTANDFVNYTSFNAPVVNQREAQTTVSVKDGETVVLGGIIKSSTSTTVNKIPILGDLPFIGSAFRSTNKTKTKTELLVFLTPRIVRNAADAQKLREKSELQLLPGTQNILKNSRLPFVKDAKPGDKEAKPENTDPKRPSETETKPDLENKPDSQKKPLSEPLPGTGKKGKAA